MKSCQQSDNPFLQVPRPVPYELVRVNGNKPYNEVGKTVRSFLRAGHLPSLLSAFLYFDVSFMVWVLLGALGVMVAQDLNLNATQKGLMVAVPILGGSIFRIIMGLLTDRIGAKRTGLIGMTATMIPLCLLWLMGTNLPQVFAAGFLLGIAGASFAAAIPLASRWYPPEYRGWRWGLLGLVTAVQCLLCGLLPVWRRRSAVGMPCSDWR